MNHSRPSSHAPSLLTAPPLPIPPPSFALTPTAISSHFRRRSHAAAFTKHKVDLDILAEVTVDDLKEMGLEVGPRHKAANHIAQWIDAKAGNQHGTVALLGVAPDGTGGSDGPDMQSWLEKRSLSEHLSLFTKHKARRVVDDAPQLPSSHSPATSPPVALDPPHTCHGCTLPSTTLLRHTPLYDATGGPRRPRRGVVR